MDFSSLGFWIVFGIFLLGLVLIVKGGDAFVDAASWIARKSGVPPFIIGATIVSLATTLPELLVSCFAALDGRADFAVGNAIGSVTANTGLILAVSFLAMPRIVPRKELLGKGLLLLATISTLFVSTRGGVLDMRGAVVLAVLFVLFLCENLYSAKQLKTVQNTAEQAEDSADLDNTAEQAETAQVLAQNIVYFILGAAGIAAGSQLLVASASEIAVRLCVPEAMIAVTIVAFGTALPELVTTITAITKKEGALSAGNILGANIIDTALILPICSLLGGKPLHINTQSMTYDLPACLCCIFIGILPSLFTQKFQRWQGMAMLCMYAAYLMMVVVFPMQ